MSGANILSVSRLLGHGDVKVTLIYAHLSPDHLAGEIARLHYDAPLAGVTPINAASV
jgi:site-specific recombinase XerD